MAGGVDAGKQNVKRRAKVKTGCATCRMRKIKCDEMKPFCQKCVNTGRTCDGYESPFRFFRTQPIDSAHAGVALQPIWTSAVIAIPPGEIELLNHSFSTKTLFDVRLGCYEEARQILQASLTDPLIQYAVSSLQALREDLETSGDGPSAVAQRTPSHRYGLQQYSIALGGLASKLSSSGSNELKSALLCCQVFISIEQVRKNYAAMAQHIIQGLRIMHEYRIRPHLVAPDRLVLVNHNRLPLLDVFIIKLFSAPCKFPEAPAAADAGGVMPSQRPISHHHEVHAISPDMRTELTRIAAATLVFLDKVSRVESVEIARGLLPEKAVLLDSLESWLVDFTLVQTDMASPSPISTYFLRFFHFILKIILLGAVNSSPDIEAELRTENDRLQRVANDVGEKVRDYMTCTGTRSIGGRGKRSTLR